MIELWRCPERIRQRNPDCMVLHGAWALCLSPKVPAGLGPMEPCVPQAKGPRCEHPDPMDWDPAPWFASWLHGSRKWPHGQ